MGIHMRFTIYQDHVKNLCRGVLREKREEHAKLAIKGFEQRKLEQPLDANSGKNLQNMEVQDSCHSQ